MTLQQMEYIVAVDKYRHFAKAAESCGISQSTLSSLVQKLEIDYQPCKAAVVQCSAG